MVAIAKAVAVIFENILRIILITECSFFGFVHKRPLISCQKNERFCRNVSNSINKNLTTLTKILTKK